MRAAALILAALALVALARAGVANEEEAATLPYYSATKQKNVFTVLDIKPPGDLSVVLQPDNPYSKPGPYQTRLVRLSKEETKPYGFKSALVACPVMLDGGVQDMDRVGGGGGGGDDGGGEVGGEGGLGSGSAGGGIVVVG